MEKRVSEMLEALDACTGRSCGHCPYTTPRTAACERMIKADAAALIRALWDMASQPAPRDALDLRGSRKRIRYSRR